MEIGISASFSPHGWRTTYSTLKSTFYVSKLFFYLVAKENKNMAEYNKYVNSRDFDYVAMVHVLKLKTFFAER